MKQTCYRRLCLSVCISETVEWILIRFITGVYWQMSLILVPNGGTQTPKLNFMDFQTKKKKCSLYKKVVNDIKHESYCHLKILLETSFSYYCPKKKNLYL
jgi:hypothetical protein